MRESNRFVSECLVGVAHAAGVALLLWGLAGACGGQQGSTQSSADAGGTQMMMPPPRDGGMMPPPPDGGMGMPPPDGGMMSMPDGGMMPKACTIDAECSGACPPGSKGCKCATTPMGKACLPTCTTSADCPVPPMGTLMCDTTQGVCVPQK